MITTLAVRGYRSLRDLVLPLQQVTVITGANGTGKSNLYRALGLIASTATGDLGSSLAAAGGLDSVLWAGPENPSGAMRRGEVPVQGTVRKKPISLGLGFATDDDLSYQFDMGLPPPGPPTAFARDPEIKREVIWAGPVLRPAVTLVDRHHSEIRFVAEDGWRTLDWALGPRASILDELTDPTAFPEAAALRRMVRQWRFYDEFRTDALSPARQQSVATHTPAMHADGRDLAPAVQSIVESAWADGFAAAVDYAFPGSTAGVADAAGRMVVQLRQHGMLRPLLAPELSDGTLRYLMLATALFAVRPPTLMVLNEPETSLHPDLLPALGRLIASASARCQIVVVTHSLPLLDSLLDEDALHHELEKSLGETLVAGRGLLGVPSWEWAKR